MGFGLRHALYAVYARFVFQHAVDAVADHFHHDLLESARSALAHAVDLVFPTAFLDVFGIHAKQVAGEQGRFVAAGSAADFDDGVLAVLRVGRDQQQLDLLFQPLEFRFQLGDLHARHFAQFVVLFGREDLFGFGEVVQRRPVFFAGFDHRLQFFILFVQRYEFFHIGDHFRIGHLLADLFVFDLQSVEA